VSFDVVVAFLADFFVVVAFLADVVVAFLAKTAKVNMTDWLRENLTKSVISTFAVLGLRSRDLVSVSSWVVRWCPGRCVFHEVLRGWAVRANDGGFSIWLKGWKA
jgi:hypothetical protein